MPQIAVQTISSTTFANRTTLTLTKPTGTIDGELLIAIIGVPSGGIFTSPVGWTDFSSASATGVNIQAAYKIASSEPASWDWTKASGSVCAGVVLRVNGNSSTPADQQSGDGADGTATPTFTNTITPTVINSLIVLAVCSNGGTSHSSQAITTSNPSWTEQADIDAGGGNGALSVSTAVRPETTATGDSSATIDSGSAGTDSCAILMSFKVEPNATISPAVLTATFSIQAPTVTGGASVSPAVITATFSVQAPSVSLPIAKWTNDNRNSASMTNDSKTSGGVFGDLSGAELADLTPQDPAPHVVPSIPMSDVTFDTAIQISWNGGNDKNAASPTNESKS